MWRGVGTLAITLNLSAYSHDGYDEKRECQPPLFRVALSLFGTLASTRFCALPTQWVCRRAVGSMLELLNRIAFQFTLGSGICGGSSDFQISAVGMSNTNSPEAGVTHQAPVATSSSNCPGPQPELPVNSR